MLGFGNQGKGYTLSSGKEKTLKDFIRGRTGSDLCFRKITRQCGRRTEGQGLREATLLPSLWPALYGPTLPTIPHAPYPGHRGNAGSQRGIKSPKEAGLSEGFMRLKTAPPPQPNREWRALWRVYITQRICLVSGSGELG